MDNSSSNKALHSYAVSTSGRDDVAAAAYGNSDIPLRDTVVGDTFQNRRQPGHPDAAPGGPPSVHQPLTAHSQCHQVTPSATARFRTAPFETSFPQSEAVARRTSQSLRHGPSALHSLSLRHGMGRKPRGSHERSPVMGRAVPLSLPPLTEMQN